MLRTSQDHAAGDLVVVLGATDPEVIKLVGDTVTAGDPTYAGPLANVALKMPVYHIFESELRAQIPSGIYQEKVGHLEMLHDLEQVVAATVGVREASNGSH